MPRYIRKTAIQAKIETTSETDAVPTGASNTMLVSDVTISPLVANNVNRELIRAWFGGSEQLVGTAYIQIDMTVELAGGGAAGTAPPFGPLLRSCAYAETISAGNRVEYLPITDSLESCTIYVYDDGVLHKLLGARGSWEIDATVSGRPTVKFRMMGLDGGISAASASGTTYAAWQTPKVVTDTNSGDVTLGCTYSAGSLSSGTAYPSQGLTISAGNQVNFTALLGDETIDVVSREVTGSVKLDLTAAQEVTFMTTVKANTTQSLGLVHGTAAGNIVVIHAPNVQILNPTKGELNGRRLIGYDLRMVPGSTGNDELRLCFK